MRYTDVPAPILFHPLKHHLGYIREFIKEQATAEEVTLIAQLQTIGSSQLDLYLGKLSTQQIAQETILYLESQHILEPEAYQLYLSNSEANYGLLTLSDGSKWVLRWGVVKGRHVHLHPARYSQHTIRVKANTLKTAVATLLALKRVSAAASDLSLINHARVQWLELAPIPTYLPEEGLGKMFNLLQQ
ncbi:hypothetical protein H9Q13_15815 [Pontibacter sp. JH31]|uniref:Uncharacterized protein n=1 Tax=Pontibacter aquaedesilientis TaxID=2766980 RepID=A0ABR7XK34_9BACT|nr:hypothetical protein [Pontibacter aquaedesilientis]MBD1398640.1 hypothetical protein [Pontibacter aquaedesilientis]